MGKILNITSLGLIFGMIGTTLGGIVGTKFGGILGALFNIKSNKIISFILELSARINDFYNMF